MSSHRVPTGCLSPSKSPAWHPWPHGAALLLCALLSLGATNASAQEQDEISPACGDYQRTVIVVDGYVNEPTTLTVDQLAAMPDQQTLSIRFVDRLGTVQQHSETGPLLWTVLDAAGGVRVPPLLDEQYQGPAGRVSLSTREASRGIDAPVCGLP